MFLILTVHIRIDCCSGFFAVQALPCAPYMICIQCISQSLTDLSISSNTPTLVEVCSPLCWRSCCCSWLGSSPLAACRATSRGGGPSCGGCTAAGLLEAATAAASRASSSAKNMHVNGNSRASSMQSTGNAESTLCTAALSNMQAWCCCLHTT